MNEEGTDRGEEVEEDDEAEMQLTGAEDLAETEADPF